MTSSLFIFQLSSDAELHHLTLFGKGSGPQAILALSPECYSFTDKDFTLLEKGKEKSWYRQDLRKSNTCPSNQEYLEVREQSEQACHRLF